MTKALFHRLAVLALFLWALGAAAAWLLLGPSDSLIGAKTARTAALPDYRLAPEDLAATAEILKNNLIWDMERDGQPKKSEAAKKAEEEKAKQPVPWYLLAAVKKVAERYVIVSINKQPPSIIKEGEAMPDGALLVEVGEKVLLVQDAEGVRKQIYLSF